MPEIPDPFAVPDEPPLGKPWPGGERRFGRWRGSGWSGPGASLADLTDRYEDLLRSAEEMREIGNTRMAEDFQRMAEQVKNQVKQAQVAALENRPHIGLSGVGELSRTPVRLARKPDGSWVDMPGRLGFDSEPLQGQARIAGGVGELPLKSHKTPDFIRSLKGDSDLFKWLQRVAGVGAPGGPAEELMEEAYESAFHIQQNPGENVLNEIAKKFGNKYGPKPGSGTPKVPAMAPVEGLLFGLRNFADEPKELDHWFPGLRQEKAIVTPQSPHTGARDPLHGGVPPGQRHRAPGRWEFTVGELLDDIFKHGKDSKKALAFASMERFGHPEYAEQIVKVVEYLDPEAAWNDSIQLQEGLANQLGRPDLHDKVAAASPARGGTSAGWMTEAEDSAYQIRQQLGGLNPEYVSPTGPTGHRLSPPMPPSPMRLPTGGGPGVGTDPLRPMTGPNYNLETLEEFMEPQRQLPRASVTPDDVWAAAEKNVVGVEALSLDDQLTKDFWGEMADEPRRPQPRSPAIGELMPGPKGGYPGGPPVGRGLTDFVSPKTGGRFQQGSGPAGWFDRPAYLPPPPHEPYGHRVPGGVQLQMQLASGKPIRQPVDASRFGPVLSEFYKMFPGRSVKDAAQLLPKGARGLSSLMGRFGEQAVRLALKLPK